MTVPRLRPARERLAGAVAIRSEFNPLKLGIIVGEKNLLQGAVWKLPGAQDYDQVT